MKLKDFEIQTLDLEGDGFYIERDLRLHNLQVSKEFMFEKDSSKDIFTFIGVTKSELREFMWRKPIKCSKVVIESEKTKITSQYIILEEPSHFQIITEGTGDNPVHWIEVKDHRNIFNLVQSTSPTSLLFRLKEGKTNLSEEALIKSSLSLDHANHELIYITGDSGSGKTSLALSLTRKLKVLYPDRMVLFVNLDDFKNIEESYVRNADQIKSILQSPWQTEEELNAILNIDNAVKVELILDGKGNSYVWDTFLQNGIQIFQPKSIRVWLTTPLQLHFLIPNLEKKLTEGNVRIAKLLPLSRQQQISFLTSFWISRNSYLEGEEGKLTKFAEICLDERVSALAKDLQLPSNCALVAELFEDEASSSSLPIVNINKIGKVNSFPELYELYVRMKLSQLTASSSDKMSLSDLAYYHTEASLVNLFPSQSEKMQRLLLKTGSRSNLPPPPLSSHPSNADYFVAKFFSEEIKKWRRNERSLHDDEFLHFLFEDVFDSHLDFQNAQDFNPTRQFKHPCLSQFLNYLLGDLFLLPPAEGKLLLLDNDSSAKEVFKKKSFQIQEIAKTCVSQKYLNIFRFIEKVLSFYDYSEDVFNMSFLKFTIREKNLDCFKIVFTLMEAYSNGNVSDILNTAVEAGALSIVDFLLGKENFRKVVEKVGCDDAEPVNPGKYRRLVRANRFQNKTRFLIKNCIEHTKDKDKVEIEQRKDILKRLFQINPNLLQKSQEKSPILQDNVHIGLILELIKTGEIDFSKVDEGGRTIIHLNSYGRGFTPEEYWRLIEAIPITSLKDLVKVENSSGETPLSSLVKNMDPGTATLERFKEAEADFNFGGVEASEGSQIVYDAVKSGWSRETIEKLIELGAKANTSYDEDRLLQIAAEWARKEVLRMVLEMRIQSETGSTKALLNFVFGNKIGLNYENDKEKEEEEESKNLFHPDMKKIHAAVAYIPLLYSLFRLFEEEEDDPKDIDVNAVTQVGSTRSHKHS